MVPTFTHRHYTRVTQTSLWITFSLFSPEVHIGFRTESPEARFSIGDGLTTHAPTRATKPGARFRSSALSPRRHTPTRLLEDPDAVRAPILGILLADLLQQRAKLLGRNMSFGDVESLLCYLLQPSRRCLAPSPPTHNDWSFCSGAAEAPAELLQ